MRPCNMRAAAARAISSAPRRAPPRRRARVTPMFVLTALVYPGVLAVLCLGAGLLIDRAAGSFLPAALLPAVGLATLIAVSQLVTDVPALAPATPYAIAGAAVGGLALARARIAALAPRA